MLGCCWDGWSGDEDAGPHQLPGEPDRSPGRGRIVGAGGDAGLWVLTLLPFPAIFPGDALRRSRAGAARGAAKLCRCVAGFPGPPPPAHPALAGGCSLAWGAGLGHRGIPGVQPPWGAALCLRVGPGVTAGHRQGKVPSCHRFSGWHGGTQVLAEGFTPLWSQLVPRQRPCLSFPTVHVPTVSQQLGLLMGWGKDARGYVVVSLAPQIGGDRPREPFPGLSIQPCGCPKFPLAPLQAAARQEKARQPPPTPR